MEYIGEEFVELEIHKDVICKNCTIGHGSVQLMKRSGGGGSGSLSYQPHVEAFYITHTCPICLEKVTCTFAFGIENVKVLVQGARKK